MVAQRRFYQDEAIDRIQHELRENNISSGIVHMATGTGKSVVQNDAVKLLFPIESYRSILIGGLSRSLNLQALNGFKRQYPECATKIVVGNKLKPGIGLMMGNYNVPDARIIVGSAQTLMPRGLQEKGTPENELITRADVELREGGIFLSSKSKRRWLISPRFDQILAHGPIHLWQHDEAHHAPADGSLYTIGILSPEAVAKTGLKLKRGEVVQGQLDLIYRLLGLPPLKVVGYTATPVRADNKAMSNVFQKIIYSFGDRKAEEAEVIRPVGQVFRVQIMSETEEEGPLKAVENWEERIVEAYKEKASDRTAVAFVGAIGGLSAIDASKSLSRVFNEHGITSVHIDGESWTDTDGTEKSNSLRPGLFDRIQRGEIRVVTNFGVLTEGIDITRLDCVLLARSVNAPMLTQIIGRARRNYTDPITGVVKKDAMLIDFTGKELVMLTAGMLRGIKIDMFQEEQEEAEDEEGEILLAGTDMRDIKQAGIIKGVSNTYKISDIVRRSAGQWYVASDGKLSLSVSQEDSLLITIPHFGTADFYSQIMEREDLPQEILDLAMFLYDVNSQFTLWHCVKSTKGWGIKGQGFIFQDPALDMIEANAIEYAESRENYVPSFAGKGKSWRRGGVSEAQLRFLAGLLPDKKDCGTLSSGEAAQLITHTLAERAVSKVLQSMRDYVAEAVK
jgi:superfamily II DNA or RNA helicase